MRNYFPLHFSKDVYNLFNCVLKTTWLKLSIKKSNIFVILIKLYNNFMHFPFDDARSAS